MLEGAGHGRGTLGSRELRRGRRGARVGTAIYQAQIGISTVACIERVKYRPALYQRGILRRSYSLQFPRPGTSLPGPVGPETSDSGRTAVAKTSRIAIACLTRGRGKRTTVSRRPAVPKNAGHTSGRAPRRCLDPLEK